MPGVAHELARGAVRTLGAAGARAARSSLPSVHPFRPAREAASYRHEAAVDVSYRADTIDPAALGFLATPDAAYHHTLGDTDIV